MKSLLRSTFAAQIADDKELLLRNYQALKDSGLGFEVVEDTVIWQYVQDFVTAHQHVPDFTTVRSHFEYIKEPELVDRCETLSGLPTKTRGDFLRSLEGHVQERKTRQVVEILKEASRIVQTGIVIEEGKETRNLRGPLDAVKYIMDRGHDIVAPSTGVRLYGDVTADGDKVQAEYDRVEADPLAGIGQFTGIAQIDNTIRGAKRGELWTHAAFTGGLKSTFMLNWVYNQSVYYRHSSIYFSLEMPYHQCRRILYAIHSAHEKFDEARKHFGLGESLDYSKIRDGNLDMYTDEQLELMDAKLRAELLNGRIDPRRPMYRFFKEFVVPDFNNPKNEYGSIHIEVTDPDKSDFTVPDLRSRSELLYAKDPDIAFLGIDHAGLMAPRKWSSSTTERLNEVLRDLKRLSMNFQRGAGIAVVDLFQISREGFKAAEKSDGQYNLTHLSYANEAERSSDIVTTTFVNDDLRSRSLARFQCLKTRDDEPFAPFYASILWPCRLMRTCHDVTIEEAKAAGEKLDTKDLLSDY
jgi:hypothetical protein